MILCLPDHLMCLAYASAVKMSTKTEQSVATDSSQYVDHQHTRQSIVTETVGARHQTTPSSLRQSKDLPDALQGTIRQRAKRNPW